MAFIWARFGIIWDYIGDMNYYMGLSIAMGTIYGWYIGINYQILGLGIVLGMI